MGPRLSAPPARLALLQLHRSPPARHTSQRPQPRPQPAQLGGEHGPSTAPWCVVARAQAARASFCPPTTIRACATMSAMPFAPAAAADLALSTPLPKKLLDGSDIPVFGLGVYKLDEPGPVVAAVDHVGYRLIDTAKMYKNEHIIGQAVSEMQTPREQVYITTKLHKDSLGGGDVTRAAIEDSLKQLKVDYIDLLLVHTPEGGEAFRLASWATMAEFVPHKVRRLGVSNFGIAHLQQLLASEAGQRCPPVLNQIECHPLNAGRDVRAFCEAKGIAIEAYSPIARGRDLDNPVLVQIAKETGKQVTQVMLRWLVQQGVVALPKSANPKRQAENADALHFSLSEDQMQRINKLDKGLEGKYNQSAALVLVP